MIPQIIHYCWFGGKQMPELAVKCIESWKKYLPEYELRLWNEDTFDLDMYPYAREAYDNRKFAFVSDVVRLWALEQYGGVYVDTDVKVLKSYVPLLNDTAFIGLEESKAHLPGTCVMGCMPHCQWVKDMLALYDGIEFVKPDGSLDLTTNVQRMGARMKQAGLNATIMYRADFMKAHLDLDEFIKRRLSLQDWPAWVILTAYTDIDVLPESTATFGIETVSITRPDTVERLAKRYQGDKEVCRYLGELFPDKFPFTDQMWDAYANGRLCAKAFDVGDFESAKRYGKNCTSISPIKRLCSQYEWMFKIFIKLRNIKRNLKNK